MISSVLCSDLVITGHWLKEIITLDDMHYYRRDINELFNPINSEFQNTPIKISVLGITKVFGESPNIDDTALFNYLLSYDGQPVELKISGKFKWTSIAGKISKVMFERGTKKILALTFTNAKISDEQ